MLDFNVLKLTIKDSYSFVGIAKEADEILFYLPKGLSDDLRSLDQFDTKRNLFFQLYRVLRRFKSICVEKGVLESQSGLMARDRDGVLHGEQGSVVVRNIDESLIFYSKIDGIGALLDAYDELKILGLSSRLGKTDQIDYSQLHCYLDRGIFAANGAVYVDQMMLPRQQVQFEATDIVALYAYVAAEVKAQLEDEIHPEILALAERFREHYLGIEANLFDQQQQSTIVALLKDAFDRIDQQTALKDADYDQFYDAIAAFLYGAWQNAAQGEIWGISNFHMVWESMCLTLLAEQVDPASILWIDARFVSDIVLQRIQAATQPICLTDTFTCNGVELVPDAVVFPSLQVAIEAIKAQSYMLTPSDWDDYGYRTAFRCRKLKSKGNISIAFVGQETQHHTIHELKSLYSSSGDSLTVSTPLPSRFYSYWNIAEADELSSHWAAMRYFNHVFYLALQQGAWSFNSFQQAILTPLQIGEQQFPSNVFTDSLFRDHSMQQIQEKFNRFVQRVMMINVIDVKYLTVQYLQNEQNTEEIKSRSIRKQFVYEYLLQQKLNRVINDSSIKPSIQSHFWVPDHCADSLASFKSDYLDGYIDLLKIDVRKLVGRYIT